MTFTLRFFSFFPTVIDHDESTYLVIGNELTKGKVLYKDVTDIKPIGIFYIVAGYIKVFGRSISGFRVFTVFVIALTTFMLYKTKRSLEHKENIAQTSGIMYLFFVSVWTFYCVSPNTEHF